MALELLVGCGVGLAVGVRHALELDHVAAVSTLVASEKPNEHSTWMGCWWGVGHSAALALVGLALIGAGRRLPAVAAGLAELLVAGLLVCFGVRAVWWRSRGRRRVIQKHLLTLDGDDAIDVHAPVGMWTARGRPLLVGFVHGLAGSGALSAMVVLTMPSAWSRVAYLAALSIGSTAGMMTLSWLLAWQLGRAQSVQHLADAAAVLGMLSIAYGVACAYPLLKALVDA